MRYFDLKSKQSQQISHKKLFRMSGLGLSKDGNYIFTSVQSLDTAYNGLCKINIANPEPFEKIQAKDHSRAELGYWFYSNNCLSPNGEMVIMTPMREIVQMSLFSKKAISIYGIPDMPLVYSPRYFPDGNRIAFTQDSLVGDRHTPAVSRNLVILNIQTKELSRYSMTNSKFIFIN